MKRIEPRSFEKKEPDILVRSNREQLIADIVYATNIQEPGEKKKLAARIAMAANAMGWSDSDLHALLKKKQDPTIRSFTRFVWWSIKIGRK
jgi:hypothetical protein